MLVIEAFYDEKSKEGLFSAFLHLVIGEKTNEEKANCRFWYPDS